MHAFLYVVTFRAPTILASTLWKLKKICDMIGEKGGDKRVVRSLQHGKANLYKRPSEYSPKGISV